MKNKIGAGNIRISPLSGDEQCITCHYWEGDDESHVYDEVVGTEVWQYGYCQHSKQKGEFIRPEYTCNFWIG